MAEVMAKSSAVGAERWDYLKQKEEALQVRQCQDGAMDSLHLIGSGERRECFSSERFAVREHHRHGRSSFIGHSQEPNHFLA